MVALRRVRIGFGVLRWRLAHCSGGRRSPQTNSLARKETCNETRSEPRLRGDGRDRIGPAPGRQGGRGARLRLGLGGGGVRLGRGDHACVARRTDDHDQARLGDLPDARPHAGDDGDDRGNDRSAVGGAHGPWPRVLRPAGRRGLARAAIRSPAASHPRVRRRRTQGARPRARRIPRRDDRAAASRRSREAAQADDLPRPGADPDLPRRDRPEEHRARRRDRRGRRPPDPRFLDGEIQRLSQTPHRAHHRRAVHPGGVEHLDGARRDAGRSADVLADDLTAALPADVVRAASPDWALACGLALWDAAA